MSMEPYIRTLSGNNLYFLDPKPEQIDIKDIANALGMQSRWAGHIRKFYSVAEHCINAAKLVPNEFKLQTLLHDASEAYLVDIPSPVKAFLPDYLKIEETVQRAICSKYNVAYPFAPEVKQADTACLVAEALNLRPTTGDLWIKSPTYKSVYTLDDKYIIGYTPDVIAKVFLLRFNEYREGVFRIAA